MSHHLVDDDTHTDYCDSFSTARVDRFVRPSRRPFSIPVAVTNRNNPYQWAKLVASDIEAEAGSITVSLAGSARERLEELRERSDVKYLGVKPRGTQPYYL
jgi:hypothetical protein